MTLETPTFTTLADIDEERRQKAFQCAIDDITRRLDETKLRTAYHQTFGVLASWPPPYAWLCGVVAALDLLEPRNSKAFSATE